MTWEKRNRAAKLSKSSMKEPEVHWVGPRTSHQDDEPDRRLDGDGGMNLMSQQAARNMSQTQGSKRIFVFLVSPLDQIQNSGIPTCNASGVNLHV